MRFPERYPLSEQQIAFAAQWWMRQLKEEIPAPVRIRFRDALRELITAGDEKYDLFYGGDCQIATDYGPSLMLSDAFERAGLYRDGMTYLPWKAVTTLTSDGRVVFASLNSPTAPKQIYPSLDITIKVAEEFSRYPGGSWRSDGPYSGEQFRQDLLAPALLKYSDVTVSLDGALGYGSSFLREAFGGLVWMGLDADYICRALTLDTDNACRARAIWDSILQAYGHWLHVRTRTNGVDAFGPHDPARPDR